MNHEKTYSFSNFTEIGVAGLFSMVLSLILANKNCVALQTTQWKFLYICVLTWWIALDSKLLHLFVDVVIFGGEHCHWVATRKVLQEQRVIMDTIKHKETSQSKVLVLPKTVYDNVSHVDYIDLNTVQVWEDWNFYGTTPAIRFLDPLAVLQVRLP